MKTALMLLAKDIAEKAVEALRPLLAKQAARRAFKLRKKAEKKSHAETQRRREEEEIFTGGGV